MPDAVRPIALADAPVLARLMSENRAFMAPYDAIRADAVYTEAGQREEVRALLAGEEAGTALARLVLDDEGSPVGRIAIRHIVHGAAMSGVLGYWVAERANGRGYATRAVAAILGEAFGALGLHRIEATTLVDNLRSQRVLERNGFERIGLAPQYLRIAGRWQDHLLFQRLAAVTSVPEQFLPFVA